MKLFHILLTAILVVTACTPQSAVVGNNTSANFTHQAQVAGGHLSPVVGSNTRVQTQSKAVVKPYTGKIELKFDTALLKDYKGAHKVIPWSSVREGGFVTQAVPVGPVVFQETFVRTHSSTGLTNQGQDRVQRSFTVADPSKFYTVHVQNGDAQGNNGTNSAVINLNGFDWIRANEIKSHIPELQKDSVLLQANNALTVTHHGAPGSTFTLTVVEGGQAGTIRRRNGPMNDHPIQADHVKGHDKNIFDPDIPGSLGNLLSSIPGNKDVPTPETFEAFISVNSHVPTPVIVGQARVQVAEPVAQNLQAILTKYNGNIMAGPDSVGFYLINVDMTKISLKNLDTNIKSHNAVVNDPNYIIASAEFGNLDSARTFALVMDLFATSTVESANFHTLLFADTTSSPAPLETIEDAAQFSAHQSWWLNENSTNVIQAWNYSMGYMHEATQPRPVKIAVLDAGFSGMAYESSPNNDLYEQIQLDEGRIFRVDHSVPGSPVRAFRWNVDPNSAVADEDKTICYQSICPSPPEPQHFINKPSRHGFDVVSTLISQISNGKGIAGVAPQAKVIPIKLGNGAAIDGDWGLSEALRYILANSPTADTRLVDVINMSFGSRAGEYTVALADTRSKHKKTADIENSIRLLTQRGVVVVHSAGNNAWSTERDFFSNLTTEIINVGAIQDNDTASSIDPNLPQTDLTRAIFGSPTEQRYGSGWGTLVRIWAPGKGIGTLGLTMAGSLPTPPGFWDGSSAAAPIVSGIIAVIKARRPELKTPAIVSLLRDSARTVSYTDSQLRSFPVDTQNDAVTACGPRIFCGDLIPTTDPRTHLTLTIADAYRAFLRLETLVGPIDKAETFDGQLVSVNPAMGTSPVLLRMPNQQELSLKWGDSDNIRGFFAKNLSITDTFLPFKSVGQLVDQSTEFVQIKGWKKGNTLYVAEFLRVDAPPAPSPTPSPAPSASPSPSGSPLPTPSPTVSATPSSGPQETIKLTQTTATKQPDFSYRYVMSSTGNMGSSPSNYRYMRARLNGATVTLVDNGQSKVNGVDLKSLNISPSEINFVFAGHVPNTGDRAQLVFERSTAPAGQTEQSNALSWQVFN